jgi:hypothetical protein
MTGRKGFETKERVLHWKVQIKFRRHLVQHVGFWQVSSPVGHFGCRDCLVATLSAMWLVASLNTHSLPPSLPPFLPSSLPLWRVGDYQREQQSEEAGGRRRGAHGARRYSVRPQCPRHKRPPQNDGLFSCVCERERERERDWIRLAWMGWDGDESGLGLGMSSEVSGLGSVPSPPPPPSLSLSRLRPSPSRPSLRSLNPKPWDACCVPLPLSDRRYSYRQRHLQARARSSSRPRSRFGQECSSPIRMLLVLHQSIEQMLAVLGPRG